MVEKQQNKDQKVSLLPRFFSRMEGLGCSRWGNSAELGFVGTWAFNPVKNPQISASEGGLKVIFCFKSSVYPWRLFPSSSLAFPPKTKGKKNPEFSRNAEKLFGVHPAPATGNSMKKKRIPGIIGAPDPLNPHLRGPEPRPGLQLDASTSQNSAFPAQIPFFSRISKVPAEQGWVGVWTLAAISKFTFGSIFLCVCGIKNAESSQPSPSQKFSVVFWNLPSQIPPKSRNNW